MRSRHRVGRHFVVGLTAVLLLGCGSDIRLGKGEAISDTVPIGTAQLTKASGDWIDGDFPVRSRYAKTDLTIRGFAGVARGCPGEPTTTFEVNPGFAFRTMSLEIGFGSEGTDRLQSLNVSGFLDGAEQPVFAEDMTYGDQRRIPGAGAIPITNAGVVTVKLHIDSAKCQDAFKQEAVTVVFSNFRFSKY